MGERYDYRHHVRQCCRPFAGVVLSGEHDTGGTALWCGKGFCTADGKGTIADLYCGAGTIGLSMADAVSELVGVEIVPEAVENAKKNAARAGVENAKFLCGDAGSIAEQLAAEGTAPDVIVVDPPRKGCDETAIRAMV